MSISKYRYGKIKNAKLIFELEMDTRTKLLECQGM